MRREPNVFDLLVVYFPLDLRSALGKKRRDGKSAPAQPLTAMQRLHVSRLVDKYGDDYQVAVVYYAVKFINFFSVPLLCLLAFCRECSWTRS